MSSPARLPEALGRALVDLLDAAPGRADLDGLLRRVGAGARASRAFLYRAAPGAGYRFAHEWCADGIGSQLANPALRTLDLAAATGAQDAGAGAGGRSLAWVAAEVPRLLQESVDGLERVAGVLRGLKAIGDLDGSVPVPTVRAGGSPDGHAVLDPA